MPWTEVKPNLFEIRANRKETAFIYKEPGGLKWIFEVRKTDDPMAEGTMITLKAWNKKKAIELGSRAFVEYCNDRGTSK